MALNISAFSIRNPLPPLVLAAATIALGLISFNRLPVTRMPNVDAPVVSVTVTQFGAASAELESQVTKTIEDAVSSVSGAHHITSLISDGISNTTILFRLETDTDRAVNDVKDAVSRARVDLPRGIDEPIVQRVEIAGLPILTYAAIAPGKTPEQLSWFVQDVLVRGLQEVRGVGRVERVGSVDREIRVGLDPIRLQAVGLTALDVSRQLRVGNVDLAGGRAEIGGSDQAIRTLAGAKTLAELAATKIGLPTGGEVRLDDLGSVSDTIAEPRTFARFNGAPVVGVNILRAKGASDVAVAKAVTAKIAHIQKDNPDVQLKLIDTSVPQTVGSYDFGDAHPLRGRRAGDHCRAAVPARHPGHDRRRGRAAAVDHPGVLGPRPARVLAQHRQPARGPALDRHHHRRRHRRDREHRPPHPDGQVALPGVARRCRRDRAGGDRDQPDDRRGVRAGQLHAVRPGAVLQAVRHHGLGARAVLAGVRPDDHADARGLFPQGARESREAARPGHAGLHAGRRLGGAVPLRHGGPRAGAVRRIAGRGAPSRVRLPAGDGQRPLAAGDRAPAGLAARRHGSGLERDRGPAAGAPGSRDLFIDGGRIPAGAVGVRNAAIFLTFVPKEQRSLSQQKLEVAIGKELESMPDIRYWFINENGQRNVTFIVSGEDDAAVANVADELATQMRRLTSIRNVSSGAPLNRPELRIYPRQDLTVRLGVSTESLSETIRVATIGDVGPALAKFDAGDRVVPIRVLLDEKARADLQVLQQLRVPTRAGPGVPLIGLADIRFDAGPVAISRYDRQRQAVVEADLVEGAALSDAAQAVRDLPVVKNLPPKVTSPTAATPRSRPSCSRGSAGRCATGC